MRVALTVSLVVDEEAWAAEYGIPADRVRDDVRAHVANALHSHYVEELRLASEAIVKRPNNHRMANPFR
jgi:hypothetical protein